MAPSSEYAEKVASATPSFVLQEIFLFDKPKVFAIKKIFHSWNKSKIFIMAPIHGQHNIRDLRADRFWETAQPQLHFLFQPFQLFLRRFQQQVFLERQRGRGGPGDGHHVGGQAQTTG